MLCLLLLLLSTEGCRTSTPDGEAIAVKALSGPGPTFVVPEQQIPKHWTVIAYGDTRFTDPANHEVTNPEARRALVEKIAAEHPDALLISGDIPYDGADANDYAVFESETKIWRDEKLRVYPALGNHELHKDEIKEPKNWWSAFPELKGRRWYSVEFGNAYFLCLDSNLPLTAGSRQQLWLADQLAHLPGKTQFVFLMLHHPPVADSIEDSSSHDVRPTEKVLALILRQKARKMHSHLIVVAGHIHNYQRFYQDGITYLVSGGGGAKPHPVHRTAEDLYQDPSFPNYHYIVFRYDDNKLDATMVRLADGSGQNPKWEVKDSFTIPGLSGK